MLRWQRCLAAVAVIIDIRHYFSHLSTFYRTHAIILRLGFVLLLLLLLLLMMMMVRNNANVTSYLSVLSTYVCSVHSCHQTSVRNAILCPTACRLSLWSGRTILSATSTALRMLLHTRVGTWIASARLESDIVLQRLLRSGPSAWSRRFTPADIKRPMYFIQNIIINRDVLFLLNQVIK